MQSRGMLLALIMAATMLAGCSGSSPAGDFVTPEQDDEGRYVIRMTASLRFVPENAVVPVGSTVVWVHDGGGLHDTQSEDDLWKSQLLDQDEEYTFTFNQAGDYPYHCNPHRASGMVGVIRAE